MCRRGVSELMLVVSSALPPPFRRRVVRSPLRRGGEQPYARFTIVDVHCRQRRSFFAETPRSWWCRLSGRVAFAVFVGRRLRQNSVDSRQSGMTESKIEAFPPPRFEIGRTDNRNILGYLSLLPLPKHD